MGILNLESQIVCRLPPVCLMNSKGWFVVQTGRDDLDLLVLNLDESNVNNCFPITLSRMSFLLTTAIQSKQNPAATSKEDLSVPGRQEQE